MTSKTSEPSDALSIAQRVAESFASLPQVEAVVLAGSQSSEFADAASDVDLYVYVTKDIPLDERERIAGASPRTEIGNATWEPGDEWVDAERGMRVDVMYRQVRWIEEQLDRVLVRHEPSVGYSTCFWYNVLHSQILFDRAGWFEALHRRAGQGYPGDLKRAIIAKNYPLLRQNQSSYLHQIELAVMREDLVSVNHRVAALLASYFEVLFALNELPHPGEKRLIQYAVRSCAKRPAEMERQADALLASLGNPDRNTVLRVISLVDGLDELLLQENMVPQNRLNLMP